MAVFANLNNGKTPVYDFSGACGASASVILPIWQTRTFFLFQNNGAADMWLTFGGATAAATLTNGAVTSVSVVNAGISYTYAPLVRFIGGGYPPTPGTLLQNTEGVGVAYPGGAPAPANPAQAHATLSGATVGSITVDWGGSGYQTAPYVYLENDPRDPFGTAVPTSTFGIYVKTGTPPIIFKSEFCPTSQVAVLGTNTQKFTCYAAP